MKSFLASSMMVHKMQLVKKFRDIELYVTSNEYKVMLHMIEISYDLRRLTKEAQNGTILFQGISHPFKNDSLRGHILGEAYKSGCSVHLGASKIYQGLRKIL
ncbi:hypothetical protein CR513_52274, partial [Mucuna pruriens]